MKKYIVFVSVILLFMPILVDAQNLVPPRKTVRNKTKVAFPEVPRVSAYEAHVKYKVGKAIIIQAGGESFKKRHILGAINLGGGAERVVRKEIKLPKFPRKGIEIFTYCY